MILAIATKGCRYEVLLISFLFCSNIATNCSCQFAEPIGCGVVAIWVGNGVITSCRYEFLLFFPDLPLLFFSYSYGMQLPICERLRPLVVELPHFWWKMGSPKAAGMSSYPFFMIFVSFYFYIATECTCQFAKGYPQQLWSYINFGGKWGHQRLQVWILPLFSWSFFYYFFI